MIWTRSATASSAFLDFKGRRLAKKYFTIWRDVLVAFTVLQLLAALHALALMRINQSR
jgi:hypothetical protein